MSSCQAPYVLFLHTSSELGVTPPVALTPEVELGQLQILEPDYLISAETLEESRGEDVLWVFTSRHAVSAVASVGSFAGQNCAAVGAATADSLSKAGAANVVIPERFCVQGLNKKLDEVLTQVNYKKIFYFRGERIKESLNLGHDIAIQEHVSYRMQSKALTKGALDALRLLEQNSEGYICTSSRQVFSEFQRIISDKLLPVEAEKIRTKPVCIFSESLRSQVEECGYSVCFSGSGQSYQEFLNEVVTFISFRDSRRKCEES